MLNVFEKIGKAAKKTKYTDEIYKCFDAAVEAIKSEHDRVQVDETIEKKDLVAGSDVVVSFSLPDLRDKPPDVSSCIPCAEVQLKKVDAFFCSWMDSCFTCGSSGAPDTFLFCVDCGEAFHSFCVSAPVRCMDADSVGAWRCPNCKICEISGDVPADETRMIYCEMCDRAFSLDLLDPPLPTVPEGLWICGLCVDCKVCGNTAETQGSSAKFWSQDPLKCFRCGGCTCLMGEDMAKCQVCQKLLRNGDSDFQGCRMCGALVHHACDPSTIGNEHDKTQQNQEVRILILFQLIPHSTCSPLLPSTFAPHVLDQTKQQTPLITRKNVYCLQTSQQVLSRKPTRVSPMSSTKLISPCDI